MNERKPFTRLHHEVLVDNPWHRYCRDRYVQADGSEGVYYHIDMPGSCASIPVFADGSTVLVHVHRYLLGIDLWEFPIGGMSAGDDPLWVAQMELHEEAGLRARTWTPLGRFGTQSVLIEGLRYGGQFVQAWCEWLVLGLRSEDLCCEQDQRIAAFEVVGG